MTEPLPRRYGSLWLPALGLRVLDRPCRRPGTAEARLRVWHASEGGFFAVVTDPGTRRGIPELAAAEDTWRRLAGQYGHPLGMAELWPGGEVDLVLPPREGQLGWLQAYPHRPGHSLAGVVATWWAVNGDVILAP